VGRRLAETFIDSATRFPDRVAVSHDGRELTYQDLLGQATSVSVAIAGRVPPGSLVALVLPKGANLVVAMIAAGLAGCGYVPVDPAYPADRVRFCLADCGAALAIGEGERPGEGDYATFGECLVAGGGAVLPAARRAGGDDVAYVIYTSGSTGRPKGVVVSDGNLLSMLAAAGPALAIGADDVWTMFHSPSFDFSVWETWGALLHGGRLVIVPTATARSPRAAAELIASERVTVLSQTPTAFAQVGAELVALPELPDLRLVVFGGERLEPATLAPWVSRFGTRTPQLVNMYGITETTVHATMRRLAETDVRRRGRSPIGRPLANLHITLHAPDGAIVPEGEAGEMVLSGPGVSRGYLGRPGLNTERFPVLPAGRDGAPVRCYRSGDLARVEEGELVFLGRNDDQLKVRGYRIEPHEVEVALLDCPEVEAAVVVSASAGEGDDRLVAFVQSPKQRCGSATLDGAAMVDSAHDEAAIKARLAGVLPTYLCPSHVYRLGELPRTPNGKIDRNGLADRATGHLRAVTAGTAAAGPDGGRQASPQPDGVAGRVIALGRRVIGVAHLDEDRDVFDQGATSLAVVRLLAEISVNFGIEVGPEQLMADSTLAGIAGFVARRMIAAH
jgi:amino acid adenylation domain-containing protein